MSAPAEQDPHPPLAVDDRTHERRAWLNGYLWRSVDHQRTRRSEIEVIAALQARVGNALWAHAFADADVEDRVMDVVVAGLAYLDDCARRRGEEARRS